MDCKGEVSMSQTPHIGVTVRNVKNENGRGTHQVFQFSGIKKTGQQAENVPPLNKQDFCAQMKEYVDGIFDPTTAMSDENKQKFEQEIQRKIRTGEKLTADEMQYLRIHNPQLYAMMARVQAQREALEARLKSCKSKQEAQEVYMEEVAHISDDDPAAEALHAAFNNAWQEFAGSEEYQELPDTKEEAQDEQTLTKTDWKKGNLRK